MSNREGGILFLVLDHLVLLCRWLPLCCACSCLSQQAFINNQLAGRLRPSCFSSSLHQEAFVFNNSDFFNKSV